MGGGLLTLTAMVLQIKVDWAEVGSTLAFTTWASLLHPCAWCAAERDSMFMPVAADPCVFPFELLSLESYIAACEACERVVVVTCWLLFVRVVAFVEYSNS